MDDPAPLTVTDPLAAEALLDRRGRRWLVPFLGEARGVAEAAAELGERPGLALHHVRRFERLGLLRPAGTRPRAGRPVRLYRAAARRFFVPFAVTGAASLEEWLIERGEGFERAFARGVARLLPRVSGPHVGVVIEAGRREYLSADGRERLDLHGPDTPAVSGQWDTLELDHADAKALQLELRAVYEKYAGRRGAQRYLFRYAIAPWEG